MAVTVTHQKVSGVADSGDTTLVQPSDWNATHTLSGLGSGVETALGIAVGSAGGPVTNGGALGTPSSGTLTNTSGLPISTGVSGLGTGIATALAVNVGSAGAPVTFNGALGTPSSGTLTNCTGLPVAGGGTGATTLTGILKGNGTSAFTAVTAPSGTIVGTSDTQTLSGKTLTGTKETVFTITDGAAFEIDPANGGIQTITLTASRTPAATNFTAGQSVTLMIADGTAYTITWSTVAVTWVGGAAPTLATSGYTVVELWKVGSTIYGAHVGDVA